MKAQAHKDLVALVADVQQEKTLETLLRERRPSLGIREITFDIYRHPRQDPGVFHEAHDFLAPVIDSYSHALVLLDEAWEGAPGGADVLRSELMARLARKGWTPERCQAIVIRPELEAWVWANSAVVPAVLRTTWKDIHALARRRGYWDEGQPKPAEPKALLEDILRQQRRPRSSSLFQALARRVSLARCQDQAFVLLRETLRGWFGGRPS